MDTNDTHEGQPEARPPRRGARTCRRLLRCGQWLVNLGVLAALLLVFTPLGTWFGRGLLAVDPLEKSDYIVVLSGNFKRMIEGARLYREGWAGKVIISSSRKRAQQYADLAVLCGVPREAILLDGEATRTADHPRTVADLPGVDPANDRFILVTSWMHTSRARACFAHAGYRNIRMRAPIWEMETPPRESSISRAHVLPLKLYEMAAWAYYKLRGWL